jgi:hypothetical protein
MAEIADPREPFVFKWREDLGVVWATQLPLMINWDNGTFGKARIESSRWTLTRHHHIWQVDTATGALVYDEEWPSEIDEWGEQVYDSVTDTLYIWAASGFKKAFLGRGSGAGDTLAAIVANLCTRAGLSDGDIDVSELVDVVPGYMLSRQTSVRGAIETLSAAWFFDGVESDDLLKFRKRGRAPALTIASTALVPLRGGAGGGRSDGESWREGAPRRSTCLSASPCSLTTGRATISRRCSRPSGSRCRCRRCTRATRSRSNCRSRSTSPPPSASPKRC